MMRVGLGYDVHQLVSERDLIIGGVKIPYEKGLLGHSDADVLTHAIMDAILGAIGQGDIGKHFPDTDSQYKDVSSLELLEQVAMILDKQQYIVSNIDATIVAQKPKMAPYIDQMKEEIAKRLKIDTSQINIKATTEEGLGVTGEGRGIATHAITLVQKVRL